MNKLFENWNKFLEEESKDKYGSEVSDRAQDTLDDSYTFEQIEEMVHELLEADDRCTRIAKRKYKVWPSAYASGAVVKCRDGKIWKDLKEDEEIEEDLRKWFARKGEKGSTGGWVDCNAPDGDGGYKQCAQGDRKKKPACRPTPSACKDPGKGTKWGKKSEELHITEEHINTIVNSIMSQLEEGGKCTGPTQKASSTSKGKKWMQCVKNPDGKGYKRIHWGQKGVRVTGDSGNTKRKKSFRARHGCSDAKPGTAKYMACKDW
tara:strand:+ start:229 stop:1014 length:786 start_codon:yes stop_codon:yes gene_type:complete